MSSTVPALFRFAIPSDPPSVDRVEITHIHPVPTFLTQPSPSQRSSSDFSTAFIDVISLITHQHHAECISHITTPCMGCGKVAVDAVKSPMSYLHLANPEVLIQVFPVCGSATCERKVRAETLQIQIEAVEKQRREVWSGENFGGMSCEVCGKDDGKRCAGCGGVAYCGKECQKAGWKKHKRFCTRKKIGQDMSGVKAPFEVI